MGDSKRWKQFDPNYGKTLPLLGYGSRLGNPADPTPLTPKLINYCNSSIAQESAFIILDFWANSGGIALAQADTIDLDDNLFLAYDIARQSSFINLGIRRQHEQSSGYMSLMTRHFRQEILQIKAEEFGHIIFNWIDRIEVEKAYRECSQLGQGRSIVHKVMNYLILNCDRNHQFPCWFSGIPSPSNELLFVDLIFVCDKRNPSQKQINTLNRETFL